MTPAERAHRAKQRNRFEKWMRRKWGGIDLGTVSLGRYDFEYRESAAQTAWEVWQKFNKDSLP